MNKQQKLDGLVLAMQMSNRPLSQAERARYTEIEDRMQAKLHTLLQENRDKEADIKIEAMEQLLELVKPKTDGKKGKSARATKL